MALTEAITERAGTLLTEELDGYKARTPRSRTCSSARRESDAFRSHIELPGGGSLPIYLVSGKGSRVVTSTGTPTSTSTTASAPWSSVTLIPRFARR